MTLSVAFDVIGRPAPQGSKIAFINRATGRAGTKESSEPAQRAWRTAVAQRAAEIAAAELAGIPLSGPLQLLIIFRMPCPKSRAKKAPCWHAVAPDLSKLIRSTEDGLKDGGLIEDDRLICDIGAGAIEVVEWTGAKIRIRQLPAYAYYAKEGDPACL